MNDGPKRRHVSCNLSPFLTDGGKGEASTEVSGRSVVLATTVNYIAIF